MDRTKKGVRSVKGERATNQFWWMEDVGIADSGYKEGRDLTPIRVYFCREVPILLAPPPAVAVSHIRTHPSPPTIPASPAVATAPLPPPPPLPRRARGGRE